MTPHRMSKTRTKRETIFIFLFQFFFCGGVLFSATARVQLCVKKKPNKILERRLFHAEVTSFNKQTLVLKREFRYVLSPPHSVSVVTSVVEANLLGLDMSGGRLQQAARYL